VDDLCGWFCFIDGMSMSMSTGGAQMMGEGGQGYDDFSVGNLLESHFALPRARKPNRRKAMMPGSAELEQQGDDDDNDDGEMGMAEGDDEVTEDDINNIVKMTEYIEK
jgi:hypothetical protein